MGGAYTYGAGLAGPHAVTTAGPHTYTYDASGNQTVRSLNNGSYVMNLGYDALNRLVETSGAGADLDALYDASGVRVKRALDSVTTYYLGEDYELEIGPVVDEDTLGLWNPTVFRYSLSNDLATVTGDVTSSPYGTTGDVALAGDFNGNGLDGLAIWRPSTARWYFKQSPTSSGTDVTFTYGNSTDIPLVGDWDGDGVDTMAVYRPSTHKFYFRNSLSAGGAEFTSAAYGSPGDVPIVGDWNGDGVDTIGLYRTSNGAFYLRNDFGGGNAQVYVVSVGSPSDVGLSGDWDGDGVDTVGVYRSATRRFYLKNDFSWGTVFAITTNPWGNGSETPVVGNWNGTIGSDGTQVTINHSVGGQSLGSTVGGEFWVTVSDHLGSGSVMRDSDGDTKVQRYTPFGAVRAPSLESGLPTDEGFTGQTADSGIGLIDYNARAYDPQLGRFVMADTVLDGLNRYSYVRNNPVRYTDPTGHCVLGAPCPDVLEAAMAVNDIVSEAVSDAWAGTDDVIDSGLRQVGVCLDMGSSAANCTSVAEAHPVAAQNTANAAAGVTEGVLWGQGDHLLRGLGLEDKYDPDSVYYAGGVVAGVGANAAAGGGFSAVSSGYIKAGVAGETLDYAFGNQSGGDTLWNLGVIGFTWWLPNLATAPARASLELAARTGSLTAPGIGAASNIVQAAWTVVSTAAYAGNGGSPYKDGSPSKRAGSNVR